MVNRNRRPISDLKKTKVIIINSGFFQLFPRNPIMFSLSIFIVEIGKISILTGEAQDHFFFTMEMKVQFSRSFTIFFKDIFYLFFLFCAKYFF